MRLSPLPHAPLGNLVRIKSGGTPSKGNAEYWGDDLPWITAKDLKSRYLVSSIQKLSAAGSSVATIAPVDGLLILVRGMGLFKDIPIGICKTEVAFNQDVKALIPGTAIDSDFLYCALESLKPVLMQLVEAAGHGTGRLDTAKLLALPIPLPSLPEQRRIAAILGTWDAAIEKAERLTNLEEERHVRLRAGLIDQYGVDCVPLVDVAEVTTGQLAPQTPSAFSGSGYPFLRVSDLEPLLDRGAPSDPEHLDEEYAGENRYRLFPAGTIIFAKSGMSARLARIYAIQQPSYLVSHLCAIIPRSPVLGRYLFHWLAANPPTSLIQGDGFPSIRTSAVAQLEACLPADELVGSMADALDLSLSSIAKTKAIAERLRRQKTGLMQKLLTGKIRVPEALADLSPAAD